ncbi:MAG TPA: ATPase domain-containing protein [Candidatus Nanoarchaeia archaeon]|nr:ATPase domain-containing protein [Candidatus Nanoarchaeia archaeon]
MDYGNEFGKQLGNRNDYVALTKVEAQSYNEANISIIKFLTNQQKIPGVYVTLNKPYMTVKEELKKQGVNQDLIIFIDAISQTTGGKLEKTDDCLFIGSPENLSDISLSMDQAVMAIPSEQKFIFFDSLNTLLMYNSPATVAKFIHFLSGKMRIWKVKGIIVSLQKESNKELIDELTQFCDLTVEFGGKP